MMTMKECLEKSAQVWCKPFCSRKEMDIDLAKGFAETLFEEVNRDHTEILLRGELEDAVRGKLSLSYGAIEDLLARHPRPASPTKADKVESLAELADRKGMYIILSKNCAYPVGWLIHLQYKITPFDKFSMYEIPGKDDDNVYTYAEAEAKARAFLTGLDDVTGKGGRV